MRARLEILAPALDELAISVEDRDCILASIVDQNALLRIDLDTVRITPVPAVWKRAPVRHKLVGMLPAAKGRGFFAEQQHGSGRSSGHALNEGAPGDVH